MIRKNGRYTLFMLLPATLVLLFGPSFLFVAAQADAEIRNYSIHDLSIEYKKVDLKGSVT